jgi:hypothetical protein
MFRFTDENERVPDDVSRPLLCTTVDEKAQMLNKRFQGKFWVSLEEDRGESVHWALGVER